MVKKDYLNRLRLLDDALQSPSGISMQELLRRLNVSSKSTIRNYIGYKKQSDVDLEDRRGIIWGEYWPIRLIEKYNPSRSPEGFNDVIIKVNNRYKYAYNDFSLFNNEFTDRSVNSILSFINYCYKISGLHENFLSNYFVFKF